MIPPIHGASDCSQAFTHLAPYGIEEVVQDAFPSFNEASEALTIERIFASPDISGPRAKGVSLAPDGSRLLFLRGKEEDARKCDLWAYNLETGEEVCLVDADTLEADGEGLCEEEKSRRERLRLFDTGIVSYHWSEDGKRLLIPHEGKLYLYDFEEAPVPVPLQDGSQAIEVKFSPNSQYLSYVRDGNLFLFHLETGEEEAITSDGGELVTNGIAEFIAQEELHRFSGYWWAPDERHLAYIQVDESPVETVQRTEILGDGSVITRDQRYPFAGSANARLRLGIWAAVTGQTQWVDLPGFEEGYIARVNWFPDGRRLAVQVLNREQTSMTLYAVDVQTGEVEGLIEERDPAWVNVHNDLHFTDTGFVWSSERSGFRHLYFYPYSGEPCRTLTQGEWAVSEVKTVQDGHVFFTGFATDPREKHFYTIPLDCENETPKRLTEGEGWHEITMKKGARFFLDTASSRFSPPSTTVYDCRGQFVTTLQGNPLDEAHPYHPFRARHSVPRFGELTAEDGQTLLYKMHLPVPFDPEKQYPVIITTYGGPGHRLVKNAWPSHPTEYWEQVMANKGYVVFTLDNRGSNERGKAFENPIHMKLGEAEVSDQKTGATFLQSLPFVDPERIGIFGWSYGGYMTLMTLFKAWETFKVGVSVAPVTEWEQYDTCYTERYLKTPQSNPQGYAESSVFPHVHANIGKLLLVHGMADDNVLFTNTVKLMKTMQTEQVPFDLMTYPGEKHGIADLSARKHLYTKMTEYFEQHLGKKA